MLFGGVEPQRLVAASAGVAAVELLDGVSCLSAPAIESGLAWLAKQQNSDGSYGSGAYRGNIAVTSSGAAFSSIHAETEPDSNSFGTSASVIPG